MWLPQVLGREGRKQVTGIPYLDAVGEDRDLDRRAGRVVPVHDGVDDRLAHDVARDLVRGRRPGTIIARSIGVRAQHST